MCDPRRAVNHLVRGRIRSGLSRDLGKVRRTLLGKGAGTLEGVLGAADFGVQLALLLTEGGFVEVRCELKHAAGAGDGGSLGVCGCAQAAMVSTNVRTAKRVIASLRLP